MARPRYQGAVFMLILQYFVIQSALILYQNIKPHYVLTEIGKGYKETINMFLFLKSVNFHIITTNSEKHVMFLVGNHLILPPGNVNRIVKCEYIAQSRSKI